MPSFPITRNFVRVHFLYHRHRILEGLKNLEIFEVSTNKILLSRSASSEQLFNPSYKASYWSHNVAKFTLNLTYKMCQNLRTGCFYNCFVVVGLYNLILLNLILKLSKFLKIFGQPNLILLNQQRLVRMRIAS